MTFRNAYNNDNNDNKNMEEYFNNKTSFISSSDFSVAKTWERMKQGIAFGRIKTKKERERGFWIYLWRHPLRLSYCCQSILWRWNRRSSCLWCSGLFNKVTAYEISFKMLGNRSIIKREYLLEKFLVASMVVRMAPCRILEKRSKMRKKKNSLIEFINADAVFPTEPD